MLAASRDRTRKTQIPPSDIRLLASHSSQLDLVCSIESECTNCGSAMIRCSGCGEPVHTVVDWENSTVKCSCGQVQNLAEHVCDCGTECHVLAPESHLFLAPSADLLVALDEYFRSYTPVTPNPGMFVIRYGHLHLLRGSTAPAARRVELHELEYWRVRAHLHTHVVTSSDRSLRILKRSKEKCPQEAGVRWVEVCARCRQTLPSTADMVDGRVCLLRAFGIPINEEFDGVHHGHEGADISYTDRLDQQDVRVGIHVKSWSRCNSSEGLGKSNSRIKGLYAQFCYTLYRIYRGEQRFDIVGVAIPNKVRPAILQSMEEVARRLGLSFVAVDLDTWIKIIDLAYEALQIGS